MESTEARLRLFFKGCVSQNSILVPSYHIMASDSMRTKIRTMNIHQGVILT